MDERVVAGPPQLHAADSCFLGGPTRPVGRIQPSRAPSIMAPFSSFPYLQQYGWRDRFSFSFSLCLSFSLDPVTSHSLRRPLLFYTADDVNPVT